ncbi:MAG: hypothetical protein ABI813_09945 [Bacteroidota bacterium]
MKQSQQDKNQKDLFNEPSAVYNSREALDEARLREAVNRTDTEKFRLFTRMMRITLMLKNARIIHKQA